MTQKTIGMIGIGMMGHGIARNILKHGWGLSYLHHPGNQPTADLDAAGARRMDTAGEVARASDILILCVTGSPEVAAIMLAPGNLVGALKPRTIVIDCSTGIPSETLKIAAAVESAGCRFVDAAMTRTPKEAEEGRLNLLIGGDEATVAEITPLLSAFSENRFHAGEVGAGQTLKLIHNFVSIGSVTLLAEAAACAAENGVAADVLVDCLRRGGGYGAALDRVGPFLTDGELAQMRFTAANARKDLGYYARLVADTGSQAKVADGVLAALDWLDAHGHAQKMMPQAADAFRAKG